jgi:hypothetical protein
MQHQLFREDGFPIGSGGVEMVIRQFKHRNTGAGMHWSEPGAERIVTNVESQMLLTFETNL